MAKAVNDKIGGGGKTKPITNARNDSTLAETRDEYAQWMLSNADDRNTTPTSPTRPKNPSKSKDTQEDLQRRQDEIAAAVAAKYEKLKIEECMQKLETAYNNMLLAGEAFYNGCKGNASVLVNEQTKQELQAIVEAYNMLKIKDEQLAEQINQTLGPNECRADITELTKIPNLNGTNDNKFYCDTDKLRDEVEPQMKSACNDLEDVYAILSEVTAKDRSNELKQVQAQIDDIKTNYQNVGKKVGEIADSAEETERLNWYSNFLSPNVDLPNMGLFNDIVDLWNNSKEEDKPPINVSDPKWTLLVNNNPLGDDYYDDKALSVIVKNKNIDTDGKTKEQILQEAQIKEIAEQYNVDTEGKTQSEIINEIAEKTGIATTNKEIIKTGDTSKAIEDWKACNWGRNYNGPSGSETWYVDYKNYDSYQGLLNALDNEHMRIYGRCALP